MPETRKQAVIGHYGYNAERYNPNTGLEYLHARDYNAERGRFFQEDTYLGRLTEPLALNRYAYVGNSPLNYVDPTGHYTAVQGTDAHETLFKYLKIKYGDKVQTSEKIMGYKLSGAGYGYADILYKGESGLEVYELKTINEPFYRYWIDYFGGVTGPEQRKGYIKALISAKKVVNESGTSLYPEFKPLVLERRKYPGRRIIYLADLVNTGIFDCANSSLFKRCDRKSFRYNFLKD